MGDGVKCSSEVKENENCEKSGISCTEEVIGEFYQGCFSAMFWPKTGLKRFVEAVCVEVGLKLCGNHPLKGFRDEGQVGDGPVMVEVSWVSTGFFEDGGDCSQFERGGYSSRGERGVYNVSDHG